MKRILTICLLMLVTSLPSASSRAQDDQPAWRIPFGPHETKEELEAAIEAARKKDVPESTLTEARMRYFLSNNDYQGLYEIREALAAMPVELDIEKSEFSSLVEAETMAAFALALGAEVAEDEALFEKSIKEAFWKSPDVATPLAGMVQRFKADPEADAAMQALAEAVDGGDVAAVESAAKEAFWIVPEQATTIAEIVGGFRSKEIERNITIPMDTELIISDGGKVSLEDLLGNHKALYLDFWGSWCGPCMVRMKTLNSRGEAFPEYGVIVAGVNTEHDPAIAEQVRKDKDMTIPWLVEPVELPLQGLLDVDSIPRVWIVSGEGKILYNGHPDDEELIELLENEFDVVVPPSLNGQ